STLRSRMRQFILDRKPCNEDQIGTLDLTRWPGRQIAKHLLSIVTRHPHDPLARRIIAGCLAGLLAMWKKGESRYNARGLDEDEGYDPRVEHLIVDAVCEFMLG